MAITKGLLSGIRIIDLTQAHAGPFGTMLLGDLGAEIIKVEPPTGDMLRLGEARMSKILYYPLALARNKKSVVLDLGSPRGKEAFHSLVKVSDVVISNYRAGVPERQGSDYESLKKFNPKIIRCNITGYGPDGPYAQHPSYDIIACGHSGILSLSGEPGRPPVIPGGVAMADMLGGVMGAFTVLAALAGRANREEGVRLEVNLLDCLLLFQQVIFQNYFVSGAMPGPQGNRHTVMTPYGIYPTKDGYITFGPSDTDKVLQLTGLSWMLEEEKFKDTLNRILNRPEFEQHFEKALSGKTTGEWVKLLRDDNDIACGPVLNLQQVLEDPQVRHNNMIWEMELNGEKYNTIGSIFKIAGFNEGAPDPPPDLGQHSQQVLHDLLGYSESQVRAVLQENEESLPRLKKRMKSL